MTARIEIEREDSTWTDKRRAYNVLIDGEQRGSVDNGGSAATEVEPGRHSLQLKVDWCRSRPLELDLGEGETATIRCGPNANPLTIIWYVTLGFSNYIWAGRVGSSDAAAGAGA